MVLASVGAMSTPLASVAPGDQAGSGVADARSSDGTITPPRSRSAAPRRTVSAIIGTGDFAQIREKSDPSVDLG
ncbi:hypothetical protein GCM10022248_69400 [Nonomuraea soli]